MQNYTPLVPAIYLCLFLALYLFYPQDKRADIQEKIRKNINFLLICNIILVIISITAALMRRTLVPDYLAWVALVALAGLSIYKLMTSNPPPRKEEDLNVLKGMKL